MNADRHNIEYRWAVPARCWSDTWDKEMVHRMLLMYIKQLNEQYRATLLWEGKFRTVKQENNALRRKNEKLRKELEDWVPQPTPRQIILKLSTRDYDGEPE